MNLFQFHFPIKEDPTLKQITEFLCLPIQSSLVDTELGLNCDIKMGEMRVFGEQSIKFNLLTANSLSVGAHGGISIPTAGDVAAQR